MPDRSPDPSPGPSPDPSRVFEERSAWRAVGTGLATLKLSSAPRSAALQLDYDFKGGTGFVVASRALRHTMPAEYGVNFRLRGRGAVNHLELKLVDTTGLNVWRHVIKDLKPSARAHSIKLSSRDIDFAWGPASGGVIAELGALEIAIVAGQGGVGTWWLSDFEIVDCTPRAAPQVQASSALPGFEAAHALDAGGWKPRADDLRPWIALDLIEARTIGGLLVDWPGGAPAGGFRVSGSNTGKRWKTLYKASRATGKRSYVYLPNTRTRFLRLELSRPSAGASLQVLPFEFSRSIYAFWYNIAKAEPRGWHPRWLHREQSLWTPFGTSKGAPCALINEEGMVELRPGSFSVEPMLWVEGRLYTWADVRPRQELLEGWMPVPSVVWETAQWRLTVQGEATASGVSRVKYRFENLGGEALSARLFVLLRPFQVTPQWQSFRELGGVSLIHDLAWREGAVHIDEKLLLVPVTEPSGFGALSFDEGFIASSLAAGTLPADAAPHDASGFACGALAFELRLEARQSSEHIVACMPPDAAASAADPAFDWRPKLALAQWSGNGWIEDAIHTLFTATAQVLLTRSGPALQPGPRRYTRSWIRDSTMMSAALLRMGCIDEVRDFIRWYAPHQRADGFVPCCVDHEGIDWLVEHDSHGQLLALIADYYAFTADAAFLQECWPFVEKAVGCIGGLLEPNGLLPISVSHEGYLAQPVHSYWDDFWALRGLRDAVNMAHALGRGEQEKSWAPLAAQLATSLFASIKDTVAQRQLDFIPGSIEWADFDPTSTANAIMLHDVPEGLDRATLERTFDIHMERWRQRRSGAVPAPNYTPYEIRIIGALVRLGRRDEVLELLRFFLSDRRPLAWNQWPEIAWRDHNAPAHLGDLPHTWIAAEYVLAVRCLFAYEREADRTLVLAAGLAAEWIEGSGVRVDAMRTLYGSLSYTLGRVDADTLRFEIAGGIDAQMVLRPPLHAPLHSVSVDGVACTTFDRDSVTIPRTPAVVICTMEKGAKG